MTNIVTDEAVEAAIDCAHDDWFCGCGRDENGNRDKDISGCTATWISTASGKPLTPEDIYPFFRSLLEAAAPLIAKAERERLADFLDVHGPRWPSEHTHAIATWLREGATDVSHA